MNEASTGAQRTNKWTFKDLKHVKIRAHCNKRSFSAESEAEFDRRRRPDGAGGCCSGGWEDQMKLNSACTDSLYFTLSYFYLFQPPVESM